MVDKKSLSSGLDVDKTFIFQTTKNQNIFPIFPFSAIFRANESALLFYLYFEKHSQ